MGDASEFPDAGAGGVGVVEELSGRRLRSGRLALLVAAGLVLAGLVAACSARNPPSSDRAADPTGPRAGSPAPSAAALSMVDSPVADPAPLPDRPLARAAFLYSRCNPMNVEDENCRFRLVLTDGSQYTLPKSVMHEGPGPISPDGAFLLLYDGSDGLVLRHLDSGTSRTVALPDHLAAWGPVFWSPGTRWAAVSADGPDGQKVAVVDIASASVRRVEDPAAASGAQLVAVSAHGDPMWAKAANTSATTVHWMVKGRQPGVVDADLRSHLRPGEIINPTGWPGEVMLGDGITAVVPIIRAGGDPREAPWADGDAILLVDLTTGVVRHRLDLPTHTARVRLHSSGCALGPNALVQFEGGDPTTGQQPTDPTRPTDMVALDPWTGARGNGYRFPSEGVPLLIC
ncbi:hypothetical protein GCM10020358_18750 [Amorphoplanes nipponensis]|uniref:Uncharacterized protein n=1 Tax=Actinoplanes nipponensis TaxID=135950 RepID=A0A919JJM0_9ACTN|nr:hypothetical protein [Actinoplanes nipponensis]GIE50475.1 hypothetical protein Ani05nite_40090 [Actinoplanes nipponensis]